MLNIQISSNFLWSLYINTLEPLAITIAEMLWVSFEVGI